MEKWLAVLGAANAFIAVAAGAFGAHLLKQRISPEMLAVFETGARYQMYHALALLAAAWAAGRFGQPLSLFAGWLFLVGILIFSGSLYALSLSGVRALGAITPIGGLCFLAGWICLALGVVKS